MIESMLRRLRQAALAAAWFANALAVMALALTVGILGYEIVARFGFNRPTGWSDVATAYLMPSMVFLAAGYTLLHDGHIRIDMLYARVTTRTRRWLALVNETTGLGLLLILVWFSALMVERAYRSEDVADAATYTFPEYLPRIVVPAGLAVMAFAQLVIWLYTVLAVLRPNRFPDGAEVALIRSDDTPTLS